MKPTYIRRIRRKPASSKDSPAFRKEGQKENTFFGEATQDAFFQPAAVVQRKCDKCEEEEKTVKRLPEKKEEEEKKVQRMTDKKEEEDKKVQRKEEKKVNRKEGTAQSAPAVSTGTYLNSLHGKGQALSPQAQQFFGSRMGYDFSDVKIHTGTEAAQSAKDINAQAYTYQNHIVFNEGKYNAESAEGKKLLAHELTHVLQGSLEQVRRKEKTFLESKNVKPSEIIDSSDEKVKSMMMGVFSNKDSKIYSYISAKLGALKKDTPVKILSDAEFGHAYRPYAKKRKVDIDASISDEKLVPETRGFYDPDKRTIYLRLRSTWCHVFHETVHSLSDPDFIMSRLGRTLNEGITQYFTDIVMKEQVGSICADHKYGSELACAKKFIETLFTFDDIAKLFFQRDESVLQKIADKFKYPKVENIKGIPCALVNSIS